MKNIVFENVKKAYGKNVVVEDLCMEVKEGERLILLGPSGCGKSTTLRMIAGLENVTAGNLWMRDQVVNDVPCGERGVSMVFGGQDISQTSMKDRGFNIVFQDYALFPNLNAYQNIIYGLKAHKMDENEIDARLKEVLKMLELEGLEDRKPKELSGGQRQRVALARAVVKRADYFLLDEPLSNLDAQLRMRARKELVKIHEMYHPTLVYVTHDQIEAMTVGDRIALMYRGKMEMLDTPSHVYNRPASVFCAKFIGSPSMNIVEAEYHNGALVIGKQKVELPGIWQRIAAQCPSGLLYAGVRPEHVMMSRTPQERSIEGMVRYVEDYGNRYGVYIQVEGDKNELIAIREGEIPQPGEKVYIHVETEKLHLFDRGTEKSLGYPEMVIRAQEKLAVPKLEKAIAQ